MANNQSATEAMRRLDIGSSDSRTDAFDLYQEMRTEAPVQRALITSEGDEADTADQSLLNRPIVLVTSYEEASAALLDPRFTVDILSIMSEEELSKLPQAAADEEFRPLRKSMLTVDPPDHTRLRKLVQKSFTAGEIEKRRPRIREIAATLLDDAIAAAEERGEVAPHRNMELILQFAYPLPMTVIAEMLGVPEADRAKVRGWSENLLSSRRAKPEQQEQIRQGLREFIDYLRALFDAKRAAPDGDLITQLVLAEEDGDTLDEDELLSMVFILIVAGHVTTVNLIGNAIFALLTHPEQLAALKSDRALVKNAVEETLRYFGPAEMTTVRWATEPVALDGVAIEAGEPLLAVLAAADRDPARFADPETFDVRRPDAHRHMAFGKGIHACLGAPLARVEGQVALEAILDKLPDVALGAPVEEITWQSSFLRGLTQLPVTY